ncbi:MAG TPA: hypothetical protein VK816_02515 [Jatrophihabitantaceae bacterium]|jgi:hypothetical protein|nr:hypothetical protein [Jatrophihabitantaceae bacterium]
MTELMWIRSHVERCLADEWGTCQVVADEDGDYPFRFGSASCWVTLLASEPPMVRVFAYAVRGVRPSAKLLSELNSIQNSALSASIALSEGIVVVSQTISPIGLSSEVLAQAMLGVGGLADNVGVLLAGMFGGYTPCAPIEEVSEEDARDG